MGADRFELTDLQATVAVVSGAARAPSVEIDYEGTSPPLELFTTLGALGFEGLVPQPPPSASIDWSAGNGQPQILPFRASARGVFVGAVDERGAALAAATMVVRRLVQATAASEPVAVGEPVALTSVPSAPSPSARHAARSTPPAVVPFPGVEQAAAPRRPAPGGAPPKAARSVGPEPRPAPPPGRGLSVVVDAAHAADLHALLDRHATVLGEEAVTWTEEMTYRGQRTERRHRAMRYRARVELDAADTLLAALSRFPLRAVELDD